MVRPVTRIALRELERTQSLVVFEAEIPSTPVPVVLTYRTRTGAVPAVDGITVGAFDREHTEVEIPACTRERRLELRVEREALPTSGLPSGKGFAWWLMLARSHPEPAASLGFAPAIGGVRSPRAVEQGVVLWGHSHLDVAWLWTYAQTRRKAIRTFANTLALFERDRTFSFVQSQPQLYEFVAQDDPELFARVRCAVRDGRLDPDVAAMWVEPDCNVPSGESLLRQMLYANRFCVEAFGVEPQIAWLPDSFGFARTLPTLLAHARIRYFATTKLQWNDTTRFPYAQFRWRGPDGSEITSALIDSYDGGPDPRRVAIARARAEPLVVGYGDGGGGPTLRHLELGERIGAWQRPREWFERLDAGRSDLPVHDDELYLEYHRGVYTTHHDMKSHNAALERALDAAEERVAWCIAVRAPSDVVARLREALERAWKIVLRNQFHDVLPGTSIHAVYDDARAEYGQAHELVAGVTAATRSILPRAPRLERVVERIEPAIEDDEFIFESALLRARVGSNGAITELSAAGGANACAQVNLLAAYRDRPRKWDAWNIDAGYKKKRISV
ncbi:MAG: hypothetical protein ABI282_07150, partial [Candidatus Baltobacteraceae bacterium]